jgi:hypothetical protein
MHFQTPKLAIRSIVVQPPRGEGGHRKRPRRRGRHPPSPAPQRRSRCRTHRRGTTELVIRMPWYTHPPQVGRAASAPRADLDGWHHVQR